MSAGRWFKAHRKQVITHSSIAVLFVLFVIFLSEPLFDRLEVAQGESRLHDFALPGETGNITYSVDESAIDARTMLVVRGWAFINGQDSENADVYIVLESASRTYIFDTMVQERLDVTERFADMGLNLDYSGFTSLIRVSKIASGDYSVGIYIKKGSIEAMLYTDKIIRL